MEKKRKPVHFHLAWQQDNSPVCGEPLKPYTTLLSFYREDVTCEKCKNTAQFIIPNFNSRFGIE